MAMMISKFHKLVQSKKVWGAFAVLISVAFVFAYTGSGSSSSKPKKAGKNEVAGTLFGEKVTRTEFFQARRKAYILSTLQGSTPNDAELLNQLTWMRMAVFKKARDMGFTATNEQVKNAIKGIQIFLNPQTGAFDKNRYDVALAQLGVTAAEFENAILQDLVINKAIRQTAMQGALVTEAELAQAYHLYNDVLTIQYADLPRSLAKAPEVTLEDAQAYFKDNPEQFAFPETVKVHYVTFPVADYTNQISVADDEVARVYDRFQQRYIEPVPEDAPEGTEPTYKPLEEVKDSIVDEITHAKAWGLAQNDAGRFVSQLSGASATFNGVAAESGKDVVTTTPPFARSETVKGIDATAPFVRTAFTLQETPTHYYSEPVRGQDVIYVIALQQRRASFVPTSFDVVKDKVMEQVKLATAEKAYVEKAEAVHAAIESALQAGTSFEKAAADFDLAVETIEPFSASEAPEDQLQRLIASETAMLEKGSLADLVPTTDTFVIAYVQDKVAADMASVPPGELDMLRSQVGSSKASRIASAWQRSVMEEAQLEDMLNAPATNGQ